MIYNLTGGKWILAMEKPSYDG